MEEKKRAYVEWVECLGFRESYFALTWLDIESFVRLVISQYHLEVSYALLMYLESEFIGVYVERVHGELVYTEECKEIGLLALKLLKTSEDWIALESKGHFMELFNRCILYKFKNDKNVKKYIHDYKTRLGYQ